MTYSAPNDETQSIVLSHTEYLSDIYGPATTAFNNQTYSVNPGLATFPFLSQIAANYEEYELVQCVFSYRSTIDASTAANGQTGTIIMCTNYNPDNPPFTSKDQMLVYHGSQSGRLTDDLRHGVECDPQKNSGSAVKRIRLKPLISGEDLNDYDVGNFQLAINNCPSTFANQAVGELWVYYTVKLLKPKFSTGRGDAIQRDIFGGTTSLTYASPFGTGNVLQGLNSLGSSLAQNGTGGIIITFPASYSGVLRVTWTMEGTVFVATGGSNTFGGNVTSWNDLYGGGGASDAPAGRIESCNAALTQFIQITEVQVKSATGGVNNTLTLTPPISAATTVTQTYLEIVELNSTFATSNLVAAPLWFDSVTGLPASM